MLSGSRQICSTVKAVSSRYKRTKMEALRVCPTIACLHPDFSKVVFQRIYLGHTFVQTRSCKTVGGAQGNSMVIPSPVIACLGELAGYVEGL